VLIVPSEPVSSLHLVTGLDAIFKAYDVRGTYPDEINEATCRAIGSAFASFVDAKSIVIARDMRPSGTALTEAFAEGARACGVEVVDLGMGSTDFLYFAAGHLNAPGAMFTASHNPAQYNGIKMCLAGAKPIGLESGLADIQADTARFLEHPATGDLAAASTLDLREVWADHVRGFVDTSVLRPLKVVADTANGMGGLVVPLVFAKLPFDVDVLYGELDGTFPNHPADPIQPENLVDLQARVVATGADVGLAFDGDADRVFLIDEQGAGVSGSLTTALVAASMLHKHPGSTVLYNVICSKIVPETVTALGGTPVRTRVGHSFIKQVMAETDAVFGGEHSGHYYYRENFRADSGIITALLVLEMMSEANLPLSQLVAPYRRYADSGERNTEVRDPEAVVEAIAASLADTADSLDRLDGLTADFGDWWFNVRASNTEPLLRLNVEAADEVACKQHTEDTLALIATFDTRS
jgi:phosphomannomutase